MTIDQMLTGWRYIPLDADPFLVISVTMAIWPAWIILIDWYFEILDEWKNNKRDIAEAISATCLVCMVVSPIFLLVSTLMLYFFSKSMNNIKRKAVSFT